MEGREGVTLGHKTHYLKGPSPVVGRAGGGAYHQRRAMAPVPRAHARGAARALWGGRARVAPRWLGCVVVCERACVLARPWPCDHSWPLRLCGPWLDSHFSRKFHPRPIIFVNPEGALGLTFFRRSRWYTWKCSRVSIPKARGGRPASLRGRLGSAPLLFACLWGRLSLPRSLVPCVTACARKSHAGGRGEGNFERD